MGIKVAKIITFTLATRVVVDENAPDHQIAMQAKDSIRAKVENDELAENIESIEIDKEMPLGSLIADVYYQPSYESAKKAFEDGTLASFQVFASKDLCQKVFPNATIVEYYGNEIENPTFVDDEYADEEK